MPAFLNCLSGKGAYCYSGDYLLKETRVDGRSFWEYWCITSDLNDISRKGGYGDITYGTNNEFGFDYLRDNMKFEFGYGSTDTNIV